MRYPQKFIDEVKQVYPAWAELHKHLDAGDAIVGRYLDDSTASGVRLDAILKAQTLAEVQDLARRQARRNDMYSRWVEVYNESRG